MEERLAWLAWSWLGLGPKSFAALRHTFPDLGDAWRDRASVSRYTKISGAALLAARRMMNGIEPEKLFLELKKRGIEFVCLVDSDYPRLLAQIHDPPPVLYIRGDRQILNAPAIAIVGSRQATTYGEQQTQLLARSLTQSGFVITSGLAYGVDSWAHRAALEHGKTVGVLAGGLSAPLMSWQRDLAREILSKGGALVSEVPPEMPALKHHFPLRNRIIAGLSYGTLVIEAREKSGALVTAKSALENNRSVFAVPGDLDRSTSVGTNALIHDGAILVRTVEDILNELERQLPADFLKCRNTTDGKALSDVILSSLSKKPFSFEELAVLIKVPAPEALATLSQLEIEGRVRRREDGYFTRGS
jgi:DNA processing protein